MARKEIEREEDIDYMETDEYREIFNEAVERVTEYVDNVGITFLPALRRRFPEWSGIMEQVVSAAPVNYEKSRPDPIPIKAQGFVFGSEEERQAAYAQMCDKQEVAVPSWNKRKVQRFKTNPCNTLGFNNQSREKFDAMIEGRTEMSKKTRYGRKISEALAV